MTKYRIEAGVTISISCEVEAESEQQALDLASKLEMQDFCSQCASCDDPEVWTFSGELDGPASDLEIVRRPGGELDECRAARAANAKGYPAIPENIECKLCKGEGGHEISTCGASQCTCDGFSGGCTAFRLCRSCRGDTVQILDDLQCHARDDLRHCQHWHDDDTKCCYCGAGGEEVASPARCSVCGFWVRISMDPEAEHHDHCPQKAESQATKP